MGTNRKVNAPTYPCPLVKGSRIMMPAASAKCRCHLAVQGGHIHIRAHGAEGDVLLQAPVSMRTEALRAALKLASGVK